MIRQHNLPCLKKYPTHACVSGFTLIEIMVVIALISIVMGTMVLSIGDGGQLAKVEIEIKRMSALIKLASDEAILRNQELALIVTKNEYDFQRLEIDEWQTLQGDRVFNKRKLVENSEIELVLESFDVNFDIQEEDEPVRIFLLSSGEMSPFEITMRDLLSEKYFTLSGTAFGELKIEGPFDPNQ